MEENIKQEVAYFMRRLYNKGLTTSLGGNISCKIDNEKFVITPGQTDKGRMKADELGIFGLNGNNYTPNIKLSMETKMHLFIYQKRPDIKAIVHAHPPFASFFAVSDKKLNCKLLGEARALLGKPEYSPYALMGTEKLAELVSESVVKSNLVILKNHGILTVGDTLITAINRIEVAEMAAQLTLLTNLHGNTTELTKDQLTEIDILMKSNYSPAKLQK
ncbi:MAG: aldolase [Bacteroidetes bacterium CG23_combo_of_CG06-09_8_20_14_all_32_9]|nr:MAG: aldolase [Bacteroidetes bacterium CG23_combo_of_CG06-09_8_20_14_all_32_9]